METTQTSQTLNILEMKVDKLKRVINIHGIEGGQASLPIETSFSKRLFPGHSITITPYAQDGIQYKKVYLGEQLVGHYGPVEKFTRDQYYRQEVSRKVAGL